MTAWEIRKGRTGSRARGQFRSNTRGFPSGISAPVRDAGTTHVILTGGEPFACSDGCLRCVAGDVIIEGLGPVREETSIVIRCLNLQHCWMLKLFSWSIFGYMTLLLIHSLVETHMSQKDGIKATACISYHVTAGHQRRTSCKRPSARQAAAASAQTPPDTAPTSPGRSHCDPSSPRISPSS